MHAQSCRQTIEHAAGRLKRAHQVSRKHSHGHPSVSQREKYQHSRTLLQLCIQTLNRLNVFILLVWHHQTVHQHKIRPDLSNFVALQTVSVERRNHEKTTCGSDCLGIYASSVCRTREDQEGFGQKQESRHQHVHRLTHCRYSVSHRRCLQLAVRRRFPEICRSTSPLLLGVVTLSVPTTLTQARLVTLTCSFENSCVPARSLLRISFRILPRCWTCLPHFFDRTLGIISPRCDGVDVLVQHRPPWRQRRL